jgi:hypothetical protein
MEISVAALSFLILAAAFGSQARVIHGESIGPSPVARSMVTWGLRRRCRGTALPSYEYTPSQPCLCLKPLVLEENATRVIGLIWGQLFPFSWPELFHTFPIKY